jgi:UDP-3-O-[3-hydroxymyristoyl] glucosamine N-acyltransferase
MSRNLVIFGTGAHARKAYHCWTLAGGSVAAFADENPAATSPVAGVPVLRADQLGAPQGGQQLFIAIGRADVRQRLMDQHAARGWPLPALVHPKASVAPDALLGAGVMVAAGAVVESGAQIGRGAIVDVGVVIDHDCRVAAFCHLRPGQVCPPASVWPA